MDNVKLIKCESGLNEYDVIVLSGPRKGEKVIAGKTFTIASGIADRINGKVNIPHSTYDYTELDETASGISHYLAGY